MRLDKFLKVSRLIKRRSVAKEASDGARLDPGERCDCEREGRSGMDEYTVQPMKRRRAADCMDFCPPPDSYAVPRRAVMEA